MSAESQHSQHFSDPVIAPTGSTRLSLIKPLAFFIAGLSVAFTGGLHYELGFDRLLTGAIFAILAIAQIIDWRSASAPERAPKSYVTVAVAASFAAGLLQFAALNAVIYAIIIAAWGVIVGICELLTSRVLPSQQGDRKFLGVIALLMAILVGVFANDPIAVIGFFGAYAVIVGVFIGISIFDSNSRVKREALSAEEAPQGSGSLQNVHTQAADTSAPQTRNESTT